MANSNLGCGPLTVKYMVFLFNLLFFLLGVALIIVGGVVQGFFRQYVDFFQDQYETPAIGIIILGSIILIISFFGCCGAQKENVFMLRIFSFLMVVMLLLELVGAVVVAVMRPTIAAGLKSNMNETMSKYNTTDNLVTDTWDDMQKELKCCGTESYEDWKFTPYGINVTGVPDSCCKTPDEPGCGHNVFGPTGNSSKINDKGCFNAIVEEARSNLGYIIGAVVAIALVQIIGIWMSSCLIRAVKERYEIL